ncbi:MAG: Outer membrane usher protein HtrE [Legionellaceae bacterium]
MQKVTYTFTTLSISFFCSASMGMENTLPLLSNNKNSALATINKSLATEEEFQFNPAFFGKNTSGQLIDISRFTKANNILPGTYNVDIYLTNNFVSRQNILFKEYHGKTIPCFSKKLLNVIGIDLNKINNPNIKNLLKDNQCIFLTDLIPNAKTSFDTSELRLDISIPQRYQRNSDNDYIEPKYWESGSPLAGFITYNANTYRYTNNDGYNRQSYLGLNSGINLLGWRFRYNSAFTHQTANNGLNNQTHYQTNAAYVQHDITPLQAQLTIGDSTTPNTIFDGFNFRGIQLTSDDRMLPQSQLGYAPVIQGIANSNAKISIKQNGNLIYETLVPPGEFKIDNLYAGYGGDLMVSVTEADGSVRQFIVPYTSVPELLRKNTSRFSVIAGKLRKETLSNLPNFTQITYQRGMTDNITLYGGLLLAKDYRAGVLGSAVNTPLGGIAIDITRSYSDMSSLPFYSNTKEKQGQSYRITYNKLLTPTNTNFTLAAYRYANQQYLTFTQFEDLKNNPSGFYHERNRFQLNANQPLKEGYGYIYFTGSMKNYYDKPGNEKTYQLAYSNSYKWGGFTVGVSRSENITTKQISTQYSVNINIPLDKVTTPYYISAMSTYNTQLRTLNNQAVISSTLGEQKEFSYNINVARQTSNNKGANSATSAGGNVQYNTSIGTFSASGTTSGAMKQQSLGATGSIVIHPHAIALSQSVNETFAIVRAKGAKGAILTNANGVKINSLGFGVVPYLTPYRKNEIIVDPQGTSNDVELKTTSQEIIPRAGEIFLVDFPTVEGKPTLLTVHLPNANTIPAGSEVYNNKGEVVTLVGQGSRLFSRGLENQPLTIKWGNAENEQCHLLYRLPPNTNNNQNFIKLNVICQQESH